MSKSLDIAENLALLSTKYTSSTSTLDSVALGSSTTGTFNGTLGSSATFPAGSVLQVQSTTKTDVTSTSGLAVDTFTDITGMSVGITPKTTTSKFFVTFNILLGINTSDTITIRLQRDTTVIALGDAYDGGYQCMTESIRTSGDAKYSVYTVSHSFLDDPTLSDLSAITYKLRWANLYSTTTAYLNRSYDRAAVADRANGVSTISVMEIAG